MDVLFNPNTCTSCSNTICEKCSKNIKKYDLNCSFCKKKYVGVKNLFAFKILEQLNYTCFYCNN